MARPAAEAGAATVAVDRCRDHRRPTANALLRRTPARQRLKRLPASATETPYHRTVPGIQIANIGVVGRVGCEGLV